LDRLKTMNGVQFPLQILNYNYPVLDHWILSPIFILSLCIPKQILPFGPSPLWSNISDVWTCYFVGTLNFLFRDWIPLSFSFNRFCTGVGFYGSNPHSTTLYSMSSVIFNYLDLLATLSCLSHLSIMWTVCHNLFTFMVDMRTSLKIISLVFLFHYMLSVGRIEVIDVLSGLILVNNIISFCAC